MKRMILTLTILSSAGLFGMQNDVKNALTQRLVNANDEISAQRELVTPRFTELRAHADGLSVIRGLIDAQIPIDEALPILRRWDATLLNLQSAFSKFSRSRPEEALHWLISELNILNRHARTYHATSPANQSGIRNIYTILSILAQGTIQELQNNAEFHNDFVYINQLLTDISNNIIVGNGLEHE